MSASWGESGIGGSSREHVQGKWTPFSWFERATIERLEPHFDSIEMDQASDGAIPKEGAPAWQGDALPLTLGARRCKHNCNPLPFHQQGVILVSPAPLPTLDPAFFDAAQGARAWPFQE